MLLSLVYTEKEVSVTVAVTTAEESAPEHLPEATQVVVIGAGQAGLSVAWHLRRLGLVPSDGFVVLDRGPEPGGAWQFRWRSLRLDKVHKVNDLPGMEELEIGRASCRERGKIAAGTGGCKGKQ